MFVLCWLLCREHAICSACRTTNHNSNGIIFWWKHSDCSTIIVRTTNVLDSLFNLIWERWLAVAKNSFLHSIQFRRRRECKNGREKREREREGKIQKKLLRKGTNNNRRRNNLNKRRNFWVYIYTIYPQQMSDKLMIFASVLQTLAQCTLDVWINSSVKSFGW